MRIQCLLNALSCHAEKSFKRFLDPDLGADFKIWHLPYQEKKIPSVCWFLHEVANRQTNRQTDRQTPGIS